MNLTEREPPASKESEQAVLGAVFVVPRLLAELSDVRIDDFFFPAHREILEAMRAVEAVDVITVGDEMKRRGSTARMEGGEMYFGVLTNAGSTDVMFPHHLAIMLEKALARRLIALCLETASRAYGGAPVAELVGEARVRMAGLELDGKEGGPVRIGDSIDSAMDYIEKKAQDPERYQISTGLADFDLKIGGARAGHLVIVAGQPGQGKTSWAETVSMHNGARAVPVLIFSLEMKRQELIERALSAETGIDGRRIVSARLDYEDWRRLTPAAGRLKESWMWIDDRKLTTSRICSEAMRWREKVRRLKLKTNPNNTDDRALVVIDYLGLVRVDARGENRNLEVAAMTGAFKCLAGDLDCPVMLLSQLNRGSAKDRRKPVPSDLRDSGAVEADADMIIFPWRPEPAEDDGPAPDVLDTIIIVAKHRNGPIGEIEAKFRPSTTQFLDKDFDRWKGGPDGDQPRSYVDTDR